MTQAQWDARAPAVGATAPDPELLDTNGKSTTLRLLGGGGPLVVLFVPWPVDDAATRVLRDFRDTTLLLQRAGARIVGISTGEPSALAYLRMERGLPFPFFSDPDATATALWGMLGQLGLFVLDANYQVVQRALGERTPASSLVHWLRRGGARARVKPALLLERFTNALGRLRTTLHIGPPPRPVR